MREGQFTACATCALALHLLDTVIYKQKSVLQFLPTSQVLEITMENLYSGVLQAAECCKLQQKINILVCCKSASAVNYNRKINILVCCKSPSAVNYIRNSIFWCAASR